MAAAIMLTVDEAASLLDPAMDEKQLRTIIRALRIQPAGWQHHGGRGHPVARYDAAEIFRLHSALAPWLATPVPAGS